MHSIQSIRAQLVGNDVSAGCMALYVKYELMP
jgi:hypothetical protein